MTRIASIRVNNRLPTGSERPYLFGTALLLLGGPLPV